MASKHLTSEELLRKVVQDEEIPGVIQLITNVLKVATSAHLSLQVK